MTFKTSHDGVTVNFADQTGQTVVQFSNGLKVLILDRDTAHRFWVPALTNDPWVPEDKVVFVHGPRLVRRASIDDDMLSLEGDIDVDTVIEVFSTKKAATIHWNGKPLKAHRTRYGSMLGRLEGPLDFTTPKFGVWKVKDTLPERHATYNDLGLAWVAANHQTTPNKNKSGMRPYLYSHDYGFHNGIHLWRARFNGTASRLHINTQGGITHAWTAYMNGEFVHSNKGNLDNGTASSTFDLPEDVVKDGDNVLLIVQENAGHDQGASSQNPRGILNATLFDNESGLGSWKLAGTAGRGVHVDIDPVRTQYSQGGLTGERLGWHLNGFDDKEWDMGAPSEVSSDPGIKFYPTNLPINVPPGHDVSLSVSFSHDKAKTTDEFRAYLYVNGYEYGKYFPYLTGGRRTYPIPPGIWNYHGDNTLSVVVWNLFGNDVAVDVGIDVNFVLASSFNSTFNGSYLRPEWSEDRLKYA